MLRELKSISEQEEIDAGLFQQAAGVLLSRQFLYFDSDRDRKIYSLLTNFKNYYTKLFDAINYDFIVDPEVGMVGLVPRNRPMSVRMKQEEALLLLILRVIYEEAIEEFKVNSGMVFTNTSVLLTKYEVATDPDKKPLLTEMRKYLLDFKRYGLIDNILEEDKVLDFCIRPAIRHVLNESWFSVLEQHTSSHPGQQLASGQEDINEIRGDDDEGLN
jgi:Domain of unknown function (DUF4194)